MSFLKTYTPIKPANVISTLELIKICLSHHIPFHYISTTAVGNLSSDATTSTLEEAPVTIGANPSLNGSSDGYISSKWVSECLLEKAATRFPNLPVAIDRPSNISGEDAPELDVMHNLLKYSQKMKAVPQWASWQGVLDFVSVERVAGGDLSGCFWWWRVCADFCREILASLRRGTDSFVRDEGVYGEGEKKERQW